MTQGVSSQQVKDHKLRIQHYFNWSGWTDESSKSRILKYRTSIVRSTVKLWHVVNQELIDRVERSQYTRSRCKDA